MNKIKTNLENLPHSRVKMEITVPKEKMAGYFEKCWQKIASQVEIPGFRRGKAPKRLTIERFGLNRFSQEVIDVALPETYQAALLEYKLIPVQPPAISIGNFALDASIEPKELSYCAEVDIMPEVKLRNYRTLRILKSKFKIAKSLSGEVERVIEHLRRQNALFENKDAPAEKGDRVEINFEGKVNQVAQESLSSKNYPVILGEGILLPGFEEKLRGMKKNERKNFELKLKDKLVEFEVEIINIQKVILPELNDALAKKFNQKNLKELKDEIAKQIQIGKKREIRLKMENAIMEKLLGVSAVELPESLIESEINRVIESQRQNLAAQGLTFEKYLQQIKRTAEQLRSELHPQAEKNIKSGLILKEVVKREKINPKNKEAGKQALDKLIKIIVK